MKLPDNKMSAEDYKEFRRMLHDFGGYTLFDLMLPTSAGAYEKRIALTKALYDYTEKHGRVGDRLHERKEDLEVYTVLVRTDVESKNFGTVEKLISA